MIFQSRGGVFTLGCVVLGDLKMRMCVLCVVSMVLYVYLVENEACEM